MKTNIKETIVVVLIVIGSIFFLRAQGGALNAFFSGRGLFCQCGDHPGGGAYSSPARKVEGNGLQMTNHDWRHLSNGSKEAFIAKGLSEIARDKKTFASFSPGWDQGWDVILALDEQVETLNAQDPKIQTSMMALLEKAVAQRLSQEDPF